MSGRKPLTLEELRQMDGKPVIVESNGDDLPSGVYLASWEDHMKDTRLWAEAGENWYFGRYARFAKVYAYTEPPRLDRSAWEPCGACKSPVDLSYWLGMSVVFCPHCGRPLNDAAWEMLEKRLEGAK